MPTSPRVDRWIHIVESPLVRWDLTIWMHVPFAEKEDQLILCELDIDPCHGDHVERDIPSGVPRVLPFVRHRNNVAIEQM